MRYINACGIAEAVGAVALILLVLLPQGFGTNDDVIMADPGDCGDTNERGWQGGQAAHSRGCSRNTHQATGGNPAPNGSSQGAPRLSHEQWMQRERHKQAWLLPLLTRVWQARLNASVVGFHVLPRHLHMTDLDEFKALLDKSQPTKGRADEQEPIARNRVYFPKCSGPRNLTDRWNDGTNFRLYFDVEPTAEPSSQRPARETKVLSAHIHLKRKITPIASNLRTIPASGRMGRHHSGEGARSGQRVTVTPRRLRRPPSAINDSSSLDGESEQLKVIVYLYNRQTRRLRQETRSVIRTVYFPRNSPGWLRINLTPNVDEWLRRPQRNFGIQVTVQNEGGTEELHPGEYFEGFNCTEEQDQSASEELPLWTLEDMLGHLSISDTVVDLDMKFTRPYLDVVTMEVVARSRSRHKRDLSAAPSALRTLLKSVLRP